MGDPKAKKKKNRGATDNVLAALAMTCKHHTSIPAIEQYWQLWLSFLPGKEDEEAALVSHKILSECIQANHTPLLGANREQLARAFVVLAEVFKTSTSDDELNQQ